MSDIGSDYFERIERQFGLRRGGQLMLSPRDWQLVEKWHDLGVPVESVLVGINRAFDRFEPNRRTTQINSLRYCKQHVEEAWEEHREAAAASGTSAAETLVQAGAHLSRAADACRAAAGPTGEQSGALKAAAEALRELADDAEAGRVDVAQIDARSREIETRLEAEMGALRGSVRLPPFSPWG